MDKLTGYDSVLEGYSNTPAGFATSSTLENSSINNEIELGRLLQLLQASTNIEKAATFDKMLRQTLDEVMALLAADGAVVALLDPNRSWVRAQAAGVAESSLDGYRLKMNESQGLLEQALSQPTPLLLDDLDSQHYPEAYCQSGLRYGLAVTLCRQGQVAGVLAVLRYNASFRPQESRLLELFAGQVGPLLVVNQKIAELDTALKARDEFLSIASHDLRNPLTALRGFSQLTVRSIEKVPEGQPIPRQTLQNNLQRIIKQTNSLDKLIGKLLDVSRINTGRLEIRPEPLELTELVREVAERCRVATQTTETEEDLPPERRHSLQLQIQAEPLWGQFDRERIDQLVTNLLDNAVKYSPEGGPVLLSLHRLSDDRAELQVRDQGVGIPEEKQSVIFNRWSRVHSARGGEVGEVHGLGLGLFICREIVRKHGGQICLDSEPGQGSTFIVTLPLSDPAQ